MTGSTHTDQQLPLLLSHDVRSSSRDALRTSTVKPAVSSSFVSRGEVQSTAPSAAIRKVTGELGWLTSLTSGVQIATSLPWINVALAGRPYSITEVEASYSIANRAFGLSLPATRNGFPMILTSVVNRQSARTWQPFITGRSAGDNC